MRVQQTETATSFRRRARACGQHEGGVRVADGMHRGGAWWAAVVLALCMLTLSCTLVPGVRAGVACASGDAAQAWADEPATDDNAVNPQQLPDSSFIYDTSIDDLASADAYYDNQTVQVTGEVVGDSIKEGFDDSHRWITLASDGGASTIAVWMPTESADKIDTFGAYGKVGTTLQVRGTFHLVDQQHDGVSDLHAEVVSVVKPGHATPDKLDPAAFAPGVAAVIVGLALTGVYYWLRERQR